MPNRRYEDFALSTLVIFGFTIVCVGLMIIFQTTLVNRKVGKSNNTYLQTMICIDSVIPVERTPKYVQSCYDKAEAANAVKITRFGDGIKE